MLFSSFASGYFKYIKKTYISTKIKKWESFLNEERDFNEANEYDLMRGFIEFALKSPDEFKKVYFIIKESDPVIFPIMKKSLEEVKKLFDFE